jgi:hypothetical protein
MSLREKISEQAKTLAQLGSKCISLNRMCKDCTGDCEFVGTPTFLGKWVSVGVVSDLLDKAIAEIDKIMLSDGDALPYGEVRRQVLALLGDGRDNKK